jgi:hypothetical protein
MPKRSFGKSKCAWRECGIEFEKSKPAQRFHSPLCRQDAMNAERLEAVQEIRKRRA